MTNFLGVQVRTSPIKAVSPRHHQAGFTLLELMIVVAIMAILAGLAYNSYQSSIIKSRRKAATACMQEAAQFIERYYTTNLTYVGVVVPNLTCQTDLSEFYTISTAAAPTAKAYTLRAVPKLVQASKDTMCATLTINQSGVKTTSGTAALSECYP